MWKQWGVIGLGVLMSCVLGCGVDQDKEKEERNPEGTGGDSGVVVNVEFSGESDVSLVDYRVWRCGGEVIARGSGRLEAVGGLTDVLRAEIFIALGDGCYDLEMIPMRGEKLPSRECYLQVVRGIEVNKPGKGELNLSGQCNGRLNAVAALNRPPVIHEVEYRPSKFTFECEDVEICVTASDPDGDPLEFAFEQTGGQRLWLRPALSRVEVKGDRVTGCMRTSAVWNDDYEFRVRVYDQGVVNEEVVRMESLTGAASRSELTFPMYTNWDRELQCYDQEKDQYHRFKGVRKIERVPGCIPIWPFQYYCSEFHWDETERTCPNGEFLPEEVYPLCEEFPESYYYREPDPKGWLKEEG